MKNSAKILVSLATLALAHSALASTKPAPAFSATGSDGKSYTVKSLTNGKPALVMFFAAGCPHNAHGIADMNRLSAMLKGRVRLVGMTNLDLKQTRLFARKYQARFPILSDSTGKTVARFGAQGSLDNILVLPNGEIAKTWNGYNQSTLRQFEAELRVHHGPMLELNLAGLPKDRQSGCAFTMDMH